MVVNMIGFWVGLGSASMTQGRRGGGGQVTEMETELSFFRKRFGFSLDRFFLLVN
jgi:hypothetical protein